MRDKVFNLQHKSAVDKTDKTDGDETLSNATSRVGISVYKGYETITLNAFNNISQKLKQYTSVEEITIDMNAFVQELKQNNFPSKLLEQVILMIETMHLPLAPAVAFNPQMLNPQKKKRLYSSLHKTNADLLSVFLQSASESIGKVSTNEFLSSLRAHAINHYAALREESSRQSKRASSG